MLSNTERYQGGSVLRLAPFPFCVPFEAVFSSMSDWVLSDPSVSIARVCRSSLIMIRQPEANDNPRQAKRQTPDARRQTSKSDLFARMRLQESAYKSAMAPPHLTSPFFQSSKFHLQSKMLAFLLTSALLFVPAILAQETPTFPPLLPTDPCTANCTSTYNLITSCAVSPDPACGCNEYATTAASCMQCLQTTNSTFGSGVFNYDYVRSRIAGCSCTNADCNPIGQLANICLGGDPFSAVCTCRAFVAYGAKCSACVRKFDPYVADLYDKQYVPGCILWEGYIANFTGVTCGLGYVPPSAADCSAKPSAAAQASAASSTMPRSIASCSARSRRDR